MQVTQTKNHFKKHVFNIVKVLFSVVIFFFIWLQLKNQSFSLNDFNIPGFWFAIFNVSFLGVVNWWLEAEKWRLAVPEERLSIQSSIRIVLTGQALNWLLPYATGDLIIKLKNVKDYLQSAKSAIVLRSLSLSITLMFGTCSLIYYYQLVNAQQIITVALGLFTTILLLITLSKRVRKFRPVVLITILRYVVFTFQFYLLIELYVDLSIFEIVMGIGWIFLFKTFTPGILGKIGIREASGLVFFNSLLPNASMILLPCFLIWLINAVIPSMLGALLINTEKSSNYSPI